MFEKRLEFGSYSPSSSVSSSAAASPIVPLVASINIGPNVAPLSVDILATGTSEVWFVSHQLTSTLGLSPATCTLNESAFVVLLRLIIQR